MSAVDRTPDETLRTAVLAIHREGGYPVNGPGMDGWCVHDGYPWPCATAAALAAVRAAPPTAGTHDSRRLPTGRDDIAAAIRWAATWRNDLGTRLDSMPAAFLGVLADRVESGKEPLPAVLASRPGADPDEAGNTR